MQTPPLQLNHYFFPVVTVLARPDYRPEEAEGKGAPLLNVEVKSKAYDENTYEVSLGISIRHTEDNPSQYEVMLQAIGIFSVDPGLTDKEAIVKNAGASILFSASRDFLLTIMCRGPWNPILLNLMSFRYQPSETKESEETIKTGEGGPKASKSTKRQQRT